MPRRSAFRRSSPRSASRAASAATTLERSGLAAGRRWRRSALRAAAREQQAVRRQAAGRQGAARRRAARRRARRRRRRHGDAGGHDAAGGTTVAARQRAAAPAAARRAGGGTPAADPAGPGVSWGLPFAIASPSHSASVETSKASMGGGRAAGVLHGAPGIGALGAPRAAPGLRDRERGERAWKSRRSTAPVASSSISPASVMSCSRQGVGAGAGAGAGGAPGGRKGSTLSGVHGRRWSSVDPVDRRAGRTGAPRARPPGA